LDRLIIYQVLFYNYSINVLISKIKINNSKGSLTEKKLLSQTHCQVGEGNGTRLDDFTRRGVEKIANYSPRLEIKIVSRVAVKKYRNDQEQ